jgi:predicted outer membrane repeat protein
MLAIVALLGFTALAVDGSMMYSDRRYSQSGSDASSLAGGGTAIQWLGKKNITYANFGVSGTNCTGDTLYAGNKGITSAISRAKDNGFVVDNDINDNNGVQVTCGIRPIEVPTANGNQFVIFNDKFMDIRTTLTKQTNTAFLHFVYQGAAQNIVTSVTRIRPTQPLAYGFAIVALNDSNCNGKDGLIFSGNSATPVFGGGIYSNGCISTNGGGSVSLTDGSAVYFDSNKPGGIGILTSGYQKTLLASNANKLPSNSYDIPVPNCTASNTHDGSWLDGKTNLSGLVCITGNATLHNKVAGTNVTLVFLGGKLTMNAGSDISIKAPGPSYVGDAVPGLAIYFPSQYYGPNCGDVNQELKINGSSDSGVVGTILAPCSDISLEGDATSEAYKSQIIGWNVNIAGGGNLKVTYDGGSQTQRPANMDLWR